MKLCLLDITNASAVVQELVIGDEALQRTFDTIADGGDGTLYLGGRGDFEGNMILAYTPTQHGFVYVAANAQFSLGRS